MNNILFSVLPVSLNVSSSTPVVIAGTRARLSCVSASSNPVCQLSWWLASQQLIGVDADTTYSDYNGQSSSIYLNINSTIDDNGNVYYCQADCLWQDSQPLRQAITLHVTGKSAYHIT